MIALALATLAIYALVLVAYHYHRESQRTPEPETVDDIVDEIFAKSHRRSATMSGYHEVMSATMSPVSEGKSVSANGHIAIYGSVRAMMSEFDASAITQGFYPSIFRFYESKNYVINNRRGVRNFLAANGEGWKTYYLFLKGLDEAELHKVSAVTTKFEKLPDFDDYDDAVEHIMRHGGTIAQYDDRYYVVPA